MGTTYVSLRHSESRGDGPEIPGLWMRDEMLELWLRLLALHIDEPEPAGSEEDGLKRAVRDQWLLASPGMVRGICSA